MSPQQSISAESQACITVPKGGRYHAPNSAHANMQTTHKARNETIARWKFQASMRLNKVAGALKEYTTFQLMFTG